MLSPSWFVLAGLLGLAAASPDGAADARPSLLPGPVLASVLKVVDGDTIRVRATIWVDQEVEILVRLDGIDTPELRARCDQERMLAVLARAELERLVADKHVRLFDIRTEKFGGRVAAKVRTAGGQDLSQAMTSLGVARPYDGGPRTGWCPTGAP